MEKIDSDSGYISAVFLRHPLNALSASLTRQQTDIKLTWSCVSAADNSAPTVRTDCRELRSGLLIGDALTIRKMISPQPLVAIRVIHVPRLALIRRPSVSSASTVVVVRR
jgi:hypothetical protein